MRRFVTPLCLSVAIIVAAAIHAGPLNPPAGPVASSYKTLSDVQPRIAISATNTPGDASSTFVITQPGGYYLTGNVTSAAGKNGINVTVDDVTIDLNGFRLSGSGAGTTGIIANRGSTVRGGTVSGFAAGITITSGLAEDLDVSMSGGSAGLFSIRMTDGVVRRCIAQAPGASAFVLEGGLAENCRAVSSTTGIQIGAGSARNCLVNTCTTGFSVYGSDCSLSECVSTGNSVGYTLANDALMVNCTADANFGAGFIGQSRCSFRNCESKGNANGFSFQDHCTFVECTAYANANIGISCGADSSISACVINNNLVGGIVTGNGCSVERCVVNNNAGGITVAAGCTVRACHLRLNSQNGIQSGTGGQIIDNLCDSNGLAAGTQSSILLTGDSARVEGNSILGGDRGIATNGGGNVIVRNSVRGGTNPYGGIAAGNDVGPIGSAATATSPWANIQY